MDDVLDHANLVRLREVSHNIELKVNPASISIVIRTTSGPSILQATYNCRPAFCCWDDLSYHPRSPSS